MYLLCELVFCFKMKLDLYRDILSSDYWIISYTLHYGKKEGGARHGPVIENKRGEWVNFNLVTAKGKGGRRDSDVLRGWHASALLRSIAWFEIWLRGFEVALSFNSQITFMLWNDMCIKGFTTCSKISVNATKSHSQLFKSALLAAEKRFDWLDYATWMSKKVLFRDRKLSTTVANCHSNWCHHTLRQVQYDFVAVL